LFVSLFSLIDACQLLQDETTLLGAALGFAQVGLTPIVEIPYAKYLDCGADMFYEIAALHWLSNGSRRHGMLIRLQGFGQGLFGGNFHTHNSLTHMPPGVDVVCYSNGPDYVRGMRHALRQVKAGRVVMSVDCTHLLNLRHVYEQDRGWEFAYPEKTQCDKDDMLTFDEVVCYGTGTGRLAIVAYGSGVVIALQARRAMMQSGIIDNEDKVDVIDCPLLSRVPQGLEECISLYSAVLFADICKEGPGSVLAHHACNLHQQQCLPPLWDVVGAARSYNPLGSLCTFLNQDDITDKAIDLLKQSNRGS
jgi:hypothetical protein